MFVRRFAWIVVLFSLTGLASAQGVVVPQEGAFQVLGGAGLAPVKTLESGSRSGGVAASHPASPVLATVTGDTLEFWNVPSFTEASTNRNELFRGAVDLAFSLTGDQLYLLSPDLRAVVVFDLASSKVKGLLPVAGGVPRSMTVTRSGILVFLENSVVLISPQAEVGLLGQYLFPERVAAAAVSEGRLFVARRGHGALESYDLKTGKSQGPLVLPAGFKALLTRSGGSGLVGLTDSGRVESWTFGQTAPNWSFSAPGTLFDDLFYSKDQATIYLLSRGSGLLVALDAGVGTEKARTTLSRPVQAAPAVY